VRARARRALGDLPGAVADYDAVLADKPDPDLGLERARLLADTGRDADRQEAVAGLDALMTRLGPVVTLELEAVALLERGGNHDAALARVDEAIARPPHLTLWLVRRADLLRHAGRLAEAREAYRDARVRLERLPPARRQSRDAQRTRAAIDTALADLAAPAPGPVHP
jgi:tetratricopeptide (TPR) repeat protein